MSRNSTWRRATACALAAVSVFGAPTFAAPPCHSDDMIFDCFAAFRWDLRPAHAAQLDRVALMLANDYRLSGDAQHIVHAVGHAATWRDTPVSEYLRNSMMRADRVARALEDALRARHGLGPDEMIVIPTSASNSVPRPGIGYGTRAERALQRRVELEVQVVASPPPPLPDPVQDALEELADQVTPGKRALIEHILDDDKDPRVLDRGRLIDYFAEALDPSDYSPWGYDQAQRDLRKTFRREWHNSRGEERGERLQKLENELDHRYAEAVRMISNLRTLNCTDPRAIRVRKYVFDQMENEDSIYSLPLIKAQIEELKDDMAGIDGLYPELACF